VHVSRHEKCNWADMMNLIERAQGLPSTTRTANISVDGGAVLGGFKRFLGRALHELVDVINPLQHVPLISGLYRALSGDEISPAAKLVGGGIFGGPIGAGLALAEVAGDAVVGQDISRAMWEKGIAHAGHTRGKAHTEIARDAPADVRAYARSRVCTSTVEWLDARVQPMTKNAACRAYLRSLATLSGTGLADMESKVLPDQAGP